MEEGVFICGWSCENERWSLWVHSSPRIRGEGSTYEEAEENLVQAIMAAPRGAATPVLEFQPPLPIPALDAKYRSPAIVSVGGDEVFERTAPRSASAGSPDPLCEIDKFFLHPVCRKCKMASSPRSDSIWDFDYAPTRYDGA